MFDQSRQHAITQTQAELILSTESQPGPLAQLLLLRLHHGQQDTRFPTCSVHPVSVADGNRSLGCMLCSAAFVCLLAAAVQSLRHVEISNLLVASLVRPTHRMYTCCWAHSIRAAHTATPARCIYHIMYTANSSRRTKGEGAITQRAARRESRATTVNTVHQQRAQQVATGQISFCGSSYVATAYFTINTCSPGFRAETRNSPGLIQPED